MEVNQEEELRGRPLTVEGFEQSSLWPNQKAFTSIISGGQEDTLYVDTPTTVKIFKFNHKTSQFSFNGNIPKTYPKDKKVLFSDESLLFDLKSKGRMSQITIFKSQKTKTGEKKT